MTESVKLLVEDYRSAAESIPKGHSDLIENQFHSDFEAIREREKLSEQDLLDQVSRHIAHEYAGKKLPYWIADDIANYLWGIAMSLEVDADGTLDVPRYTMDVYSAFDSGEYLRSTDDPGVDPAEKYTRSAIEEIIARDAA